MKLIGRCVAMDLDLRCAGVPEDGQVLCPKHLANRPEFIVIAPLEEFYVAGLVWLASTVDGRKRNTEILRFAQNDLGFVG